MIKPSRNMIKGASCLLNSSLPSSVCVRHKKLKAWMKQEENLPINVYVKKQVRQKTLLEYAGNAVQGELGNLSLLNPLNEKVKPRTFQKTPRIQDFFLNKKVVDVACGIFYTVVIIKPYNKGEPSIYGTGLATDGQIGNQVRKYFKNTEMEEENYEYEENYNEEYPQPINNEIKEETKTCLNVYQFSPIALIPNLNPVAVEVSCGRAHTLVACFDNTLFTMGNNSFGQCGRKIIPDEDYQINPYINKIEMFKKSKIDQIECGLDSSYVLSGGKVYACGLSTDGQTGASTYDNVEEFREIGGDISGEKIIKVSCKGDCVLALSKKGELFGWGNAEYNQFSCVTHATQVNVPTRLPVYIGKIIDIASGGSCCYVLNEHGDVYSWGYGHLGRGPKNVHCKDPEIIPSTLFGRNEITPDTKVTNIYCGVSMAAAITSAGNMYSWGKNIHGCLGISQLTDISFPFRVKLAGRPLKVSCGEAHMFIKTKKNGIEIRVSSAYK